MTPAASLRATADRLEAEAGRLPALADELERVPVVVPAGKVATWRRAGPPPHAGSHPEGTAILAGKGRTASIAWVSYREVQVRGGGYLGRYADEDVAIAAAEVYAASKGWTIAGACPPRAGRGRG